MKKRILVLISLFLAIVLTLALTACQGGAGDEQGTNGPDGTGDVQTEETGETEESSGTETVTINTDFLNEYKMTFGELTAKHGKVVDYSILSGGDCYKFENGYGFYFFPVDYDQNKLITDPNTGVTYMPVEDDELCRGTWYTTIEALFNGPFESISIEELSKNEVLTFKYTVKDGISTSKAYSTKFFYEGWDNEKVSLDVYHDDNKVIDTSSVVRIYIHPLDIEAEENQ